MGALGDISNLLLQVYKLWKERAAGAAVHPQHIFNRYVQPSYKLLKEIHGDYLDMYLELRERIPDGDSLPQELVVWFARARAHREADRSELRLLDIPRLEGESSHALDINTAIVQYLVAVTTYFDPTFVNEHASRSRLGEALPSASSFTAARLHLLSYWSRLSAASQRAFAVEEHLESGPSPLREVMVEKLLSAAADIWDAGTLEHFQHVQREANAAFDQNPSSLQKGIQDGLFSWAVDGFGWHDILEYHIRAQCSAFESSMHRAQRAYFRLRILTDRE